MKISNSEVSTFLKCERRHYYAHGLNIAPKRYSTSLTRGIIGHEALEAFYKVYKEEQDIVASQQALDEVMVRHMTETPEDIEMLASLHQLLSQYVSEVVPQDRFAILAVEETMSMPIGDNDLEYAMRFDLLAEMKNGPYAGEIVLIDHKFVYNFWSEDNLMMNAQAPKYIATLRANDIPVKRLMVNQLRWREVKSNPERFRREWISPVAEEIKTVLREQHSASLRIMERMQDIEEYGKTALRTMDNMTCQNCSFLMLCRVELVGQNPALLIETEFQPNSYGYNNEDDPYGA